MKVEMFCFVLDQVVLEAETECRVRGKQALKTALQKKSVSLRIRKVEQNKDVISGQSLALV